MLIQNIPISKIIIKDRYRKDLGAISDLINSIKEVGLLQPIIVLSDHTLVAGERRLRAAQELTWTEIPAIVNSDLDTALKIAIAQGHENTCRKSFSESEGAQMMKQIEIIRKAEADKIRIENLNHQNNATAEKPCEKEDYRRGQIVPVDSNKPKTEKTAEIVSKITGIGQTTLKKAKKVIDRGNPKQIRELESGEKSVDKLYKEVQKTEQENDMIDLKHHRQYRAILCNAAITKEVYDNIKAYDFKSLLTADVKLFAILQDIKDIEELIGIAFDIGLVLIGYMTQLITANHTRLLVIFGKYNDEIDLNRQHLINYSNDYLIDLILSRCGNTDKILDISEEAFESGKCVTYDSIIEELIADSEEI